MARLRLVSCSIDEEGCSENPSIGNFFAIDRRTFAHLCKFGMNAAVAYLVLARGTLRDNRTTNWSVQAIENYTGISRSRSGGAIKVLCDAGVVVRVNGDNVRPRYHLIPACEIPGTEAYPRPELDQWERRVVEKVRSGEYVSKKDATWAASAVSKRWLVAKGDGYSIAEEPNPEPDWIWLPNELVTGAATELPPIELIRQGQDVMMLRLLIDLYHAQNLRDDGGVARRFTWQTYDRMKVGERGEWDVWGFSHGNIWVTWDGPTACHRRHDLPQGEQGNDFFRRMQRLADLGLIEWVPHLVESDDPDGEIIHPYGMGDSTSMEDRLGRMAHMAALEMVPSHKLQQPVLQDFTRMAPVLRHIENVQMIGIARLRYRPHTRLTGAWWGNLNETAEVFLARYLRAVNFQDAN